VASTRTRHAASTSTVKQDASRGAPPGVVLVVTEVVLVATEVVVDPPGTVVVGAPGVVVVGTGPGPGAVVELVEPAGMMDVVVATDDVNIPVTTDDVVRSSPPVVNTAAPAPAARAAPTATVVPAPIPPPTPDTSPAAVMVPAIPTAMNPGGIDDAPNAVAPTVMPGSPPGK